MFIKEKVETLARQFLSNLFTKYDFGFYDMEIFSIPNENKLNKGKAISI